MNLRPARVRWDEQSLQKVTEMVSRKGVAGETLELVQLYFKKGAIVPLHCHAGERIIYVLQGAVRFSREGDDTTVREGEVLVIPARFTYQAECLDDTFVMAFGAKGH